MAEDTNPLNAGVFYLGSFVTNQFIQTFGDLHTDERLAIFVTISAKPDVSVLATNHSNVPLELDNLGKTHAFYYINTEGELTSSGTIPAFADKAVRYINSAHEPRVFVLTDENGGLRYLRSSQSSPFAITSSASKLPGLPDSWYQFYGAFIEFVGEDGQTVYRLTVNSSDIISVTPHRIEAQRTMPLYISHGHQRPFDGQHLYIGYLASLGDISMQIEKTQAGYGGLSVPTVGTIKVQLADGYFDYIVNQSWDTREVVITAGLSTTPISQYPVILRGHTERAEWNLDELVITLRDHGILFDRALQSNTYAGTGGYEGTEDVRGKTKPIVFGFVEQATPVLLDPDINLYQFSDGPSHEYELFLFEGGSAHFNASLDTNLLDWQVTASDRDGSRCRIDYTRSLFRLASQPEKAITFTTHGTTAVPINGGMSQIVRAIINRSTPELVIDQNSFDYHSTLSQQVQGVYIADNRSTGDVLRSISAPTGDVIMLNRVERVVLRHLQREPARAFITDRDIAQNSTIGRREAPKPGSEYRLAFRRMFTQFTEDQFLGSTIPGMRVLLADESRWLSFKISGHDHPGISRYDSATSVDLESFISLADPNLLVEIALRDHAMRDIYDITVIGFSFLLDIGETVLLQLNRWDMHMPKTCLIVGITEMSPTGSREDQTRLLLWG